MTPNATTNRFQQFITKTAEEKAEQDYINEILPVLEAIQKKYPDGLPAEDTSDESNVADIPEITGIRELSEEIGKGPTPQTGIEENAGPLIGTAKLIKQIREALKRG